MSFESHYRRVYKMKDDEQILPPVYDSVAKFFYDYGQQDCQQEREAEMQNFDINAAIECIKQQREREGDKWPWDNVLEWASNMQATFKMTPRPHKFTCGTDGEVIDSLDIRFKFKKPIDMQAHCDFEENLMHMLFDALVGEMQGYWENCD